MLLLKSMTSLKQLFTMTMDVHKRYRTEAHQLVANRFNERFILSLANNKRCMVLDEDLNILPLSSHIKHVNEVAAKVDDSQDLKDIVEKFQDSQPTGSLLKLCKTIYALTFKK